MATGISTDHHESRLRRIIWYGLAAIVIGLPFHALLITWAGAHFPTNLTTILRYWKEIILLIMVSAAAKLIWRDTALRNQLLRDSLVWLMVIFGIIHLIILLVFGAAPFSALLALKINLGFLALYLVASTIRGSHRANSETIAKLILIPAGIVSFFGLLQLTVLPHDILRHFGYGLPGQPNPAYYLIENTDTVRIMSTLWGPNQFGSYLILPLIISLWCTLKTSGLKRISALVVFLLTLISLYGSQSRGAWLAAIFAIIALVFFHVGRTTKIILLFGSLIAAIVFGILLTHHQLPHRVEILVLHGTQTGGSTGYLTSNGGHLRALTLGYDLLKSHPLGAGLEAAGRASEGLPNQLYTENFYLQLAVQTGYEGLLVFLAIISLVAWRLYNALRSYPLALPLLAVLIGLSVNNLVAHTWSDGATAWLWWGLAGLVYTGQNKVTETS